VCLLNIAQDAFVLRWLVLLTNLVAEQVVVGFVCLIFADSTGGPWLVFIFKVNINGYHTPHLRVESQEHPVAIELFAPDRRIE